MFKKLAKVGKKLAPLVIAGRLFASAHAAELNICPGYTHYFQNPAQSYCEQLNKDFRSGKYLAKTPIPEWKDLKFEQGPAFGINASLLFGDKVKMGPTFNYSKSKIICDDYQEHWFWHDVWGEYIKFTFDREEQIEIETKSPGLKIKFPGKNIAFSLAGFVDLHNVKGNVDYEMRRPDTEYTQWRKANYSGSGKGFSGEAGIDLNLSDNFSFNITGGARFGEVETVGKEIKTGKVKTKYSVSGIKRNYSPKFDFNSKYIRASANLNF
jgi:hypothetical protein